MRRLLLLVSLLAATAAWGLDLADNTWTQHTPTGTENVTYGSMTGRYYTEASAVPSAYDSDGHRLIFFDQYFTPAGATNCIDKMSFQIYSNALWSWDLATNTVSLLNVLGWYTPDGYAVVECAGAAPSPAPRHGEIGYAKGKIWLGPGLDSHRYGLGHPNDLWSYDLTGGTWSQVTYGAVQPSTESAEGANFSMAYDSVTDQMILTSSKIAGSSSLYSWHFDPDSPSDTLAYWTSSPRPSTANIGGFTTTDTKRARVWKFGAGDYSAGTNDLWWLAPATGAWTQVTPNGTSPAARNNQVFEYNPKWDVFLMFGGSVGSWGSPYFNDLWAYYPTPNAWVQLASSGPKATRWPAGNYDAHNDAFAVRTYDQDGDSTYHAAWWTYRYTPMFASTTAALPETTLTNPPARTWTLDPDTKGIFLRYLDTGGAPNSAHHVYSDMQAFSKNSTYLALILNESNISIYKLDGSPAQYNLFRSNIGLGTANFYWAPDDDDCLYYYSGATLRKYVPSTGTSSLVKDFSGTFTRLTPTDMKQCNVTGRYFMINGVDASNHGIVARWDKQTDTLGTLLDMGLNNSYEVAISPDGDYALALPRAAGIQRYDLPGMTNQTTLDANAGSPHCDVVKASDGAQYILYQKFDTGGNQAAVGMVNIGTGAKSIVWGSGLPYLNIHVSGRAIDAANHDYVIVSTFANRAQRSSKPTWQDEILRVYLDSTLAAPHVDRLWNHRSNYDGPDPDGGADDIHCYWQQPHASASPDGNWVVWASSWRADCTDKANAYGYSQPYIGWLPPVTSSTVEGTTSHTITASAGTGGTISPSGSTAVVDGATQAYTITPIGGYAVSSVTVDGVNQGAVASYTFSNVTADHTISAAFAATSASAGNLSTPKSSHANWR